MMHPTMVDFTTEVKHKTFTISTIVKAVETNQKKRRGKRLEKRAGELNLRVTRAEGGKIKHLDKCSQI